MARAFMLVRVLAHELGHHLDSRDNRQQRCRHGERFAERFERGATPLCWQAYLGLFGHPRSER